MKGLRARWRARMAAWVRRRQGIDALPLLLQRRRIYILPTRAGVGFGVVLCFMLVAGLNYANSIALFLTFLLGGFALVSMHQCHRNLLGLAVQAASAPATFAGRPGQLHLSLESPAPLARFDIQAGIGSAATGCTDLHPGEQERLDLAIAPAPRGLVQIDRLQVTTAHPFGLFRAWTWVHTPLEMIVYPRAHGSLPLPTESGQKSGQQAADHTGADEWMGLRPFRDGDSPRQVDWKAYAREMPLLVKEYSASGSELRIFRFSQLPNLATEQRLEQLAKWIVEAETLGDRYGLELPSTRIAPDRGHEHRHRCLTALALFEVRS